MQAWTSQSQNGSLVFRSHYIKKDNKKKLIHFMPGNGFSAESYWQILKTLENDHDIFMNNPQGHGDSDAGLDLKSWDECSENSLQAFLQKKNELEEQNESYKEIIGVGHSFGADLLIMMACKNPNIFKKLILLDPVIFPKSFLCMMGIAKSVHLNKRFSMAQKALKRKNNWPSKKRSKKIFC